MNPGCFGSVIAFEAVDTFCQQCEYFDECRTETGNRLVELRKTIDVSAYVKSYNANQVRDRKEVVEVVDEKNVKPTPTMARRRELIMEQLAVLKDESIPKKARELIGQLFRKGFDSRLIRNSLERNINPFENEKPEKMKVICTLLMSGGFTRQELKTALMNSAESSMSESTAGPQVSLLSSTMVALKVAYEDGTGTFRLKEPE